jgi:hypothetical protein
MVQAEPKIADPQAAWVPTVDAAIIARKEDGPAPDRLTAGQEVAQAQTARADDIATVQDGHVQGTQTVETRTAMA